MITLKNEEDFAEIDDPFVVEKLNSSYLIYSLTGSESWAQSQVFSIVQLSQNELSIQWNRQVNNFTDSPDSDWRTFGMFGSGKLKLQSESCIE